ncbi:MAG: flavin reductase family protein [Oscillospiraceae bacterium]|nr:flavin reductase family protein [Oscillospiraceae bacterium]
MKELSIGQAQRLTAPSPFGLLSTRQADGTTNLMAVSWWTYLSNHPPMLGVCLSKKSLSGSLIAETGEFGLSIPGEELQEAALRCGTCSGRTVKKAEEFGIPLMPASQIALEVVAGSRVCFECRLKETADAGDHTFYLAEILAVHGDESVPQLFAFDGYARLSTLSK